MYIFEYLHGLSNCDEKNLKRKEGDLVDKEVESIVQSGKVPMESENAEGKLQVGDLLSASNYHEQEHRPNHNGTDDTRDEVTQAGDFLRGSRASEPSSALNQVHHDQTSTTQSDSEASAVAEKSGSDADTVERKLGDLAGEANGNGVEQESSATHHLPHEEVPQPGQYTDLDAVIEFVALDNV